MRASQAGNVEYAASTQDATLTSTKLAQTITFALTGTYYVNDAITLGATATSGLGVTYTLVSGSGTLSGGTFTPDAEGSVELRASQAGDAIYAAATDVTQTITVNKKSQTITFAPTANVNAGDTIVLTASSTSSLTAFTYSVVSGNATVSNDSLFITSDGTIVVRASQAGNVEYAAATQDATLTSTKLAQTITFSLPDTVFVNDATSLSATATSGLTVTFAVASGDATINGGNVTANAEGTFEVTASQSGDLIYSAATDVTVSVVAIKKDQTITFNPTANVSVGDTLVLTASSTSSLTGFTYTVSSGSATISNDTLIITGEGSITLNAAEAGNFEYNPANIDATITATKVDQTITFSLPDTVFVNDGN